MIYALNVYTDHDPAIKDSYQEYVETLFTYESDDSIEEQVRMIANAVLLGQQCTDYCQIDETDVIAKDHKTVDEIKELALEAHDRIVDYYPAGECPYFN